MAADMVERKASTSSGFDTVKYAKIDNDCLLKQAGGTLVPRYLSDALTDNSFLSYIQDDLVPTLHDHDIVIMDNLSCHKVEVIKDAIEKAGAHLLYLPPYSQDFNPIERM